MVIICKSNSYSDVHEDRGKYVQERREHETQVSKQMIEKFHLPKWLQGKRGKQMQSTAFPAWAKVAK